MRARQSQRFRDLATRLSELRTRLLPAKFDPTGSYSDRQLDRALGYRLLVHAEIEAFVEDVCFDKARACVREWKASRHVSASLFCMMAHYHHGFKIDGFDEAPPFPFDSRKKVKDCIDEVIDVAMLQYTKLKNDNNGIIEKNMLRLILPIGVRSAELDSLWVTALDQFGKKRGDVAHNTLKAVQQVDPKQELADVRVLVAGLKHLDSLILAL